MSKKTIALRFDSELYNLLKKRAEKNFLSVEELTEDIVRRSMISYRGNTSKQTAKIDDKLISLFSREKKGTRKKRKTKRN